MSGDGESERLEHLHDVSAALVRARGLAEAAEAVVARSAVGTGADAAVLCLLDDAGSAFEVIGSLGYEPGGLAAWSTFPLDAPLPASDALRTGAPVLLTSRADRDALYPQLAQYPMRHPRYAVLPLVGESGGVGVLALGWLHEGGFSTADLAFLRAVAQQCALAVERAAAAERESAARTRLEFLAEASRVLASSLDEGETLQRVARLLVPELADSASVHLADEQGLRSIAIAHADPDLDALMNRMADASGHYTESTALTHIFELGQPLLVEEVPPTSIDQAAEEAPDPEGVRRLDIRSAIVVPLVARDRTLGVISCTRGGLRRFTAADLEVVADVGRRAGVALENARLFERERSHALTLQRSLLPQAMPDLSGIHAASRYLPGGRDAEVGGDWFDVIPLPFERLAVVVGDVMGRGVRAAAVMGQLRAAVRAYAVMDLPPRDVLAYLDELVCELDQVQIVTCIYAVIDPADESVTIANAGHPPALLRDASGVQAVGVDLGLPLGVGGEPFEQSLHPLRQGATLLLFTDGLVERRGVHLDEGISAVRDALAEWTAGVDELCDAVLGAIGGEPVDDDVAVLAVHLHDPGAERTVRMTLEPEPESVADARSLAATSLQRWGQEERVDLATLLVSEVVTNAIRHTGTDVQVRVRLGAHALSFEVADDDARLPRLRHSTPDDEGGRGLYLVDALATRWGTRGTPTGKVVWFELPLADPV